MSNLLLKLGQIVSMLVCTFLIVSCGEYQQILKSKDPDVKYQKALMYFEDE